MMSIVTIPASFYPLALKTEWVLSLPASLRSSVPPSVRLSIFLSVHELTITLHQFKLESQNSKLLLNMGLIYLDL